MEWKWGKSTSAAAWQIIASLCRLDGNKKKKEEKEKTAAVV